MFDNEYIYDNDVKLTGLFIAKVIGSGANAEKGGDPKSLYRVLVRVNGVHDMSNDSAENAIWANQLCFDRSQTSILPEKGEWVYIMFINEDPNNCVWLGWVRTIADSGLF